jgi:beta-N-acetylhexosaminidase
MNNLSLDEKTGQLFMIGFEGQHPCAAVESFIQTNNIGFVILFSRNIETAAGVKKLTGHIHSLAKVRPLIYADQEGGTIVRFEEMAATVISAMGLAASGLPGNARTAGKLIGEDMRLCGIDGVFAPVLDVNTAEDNPVIGVRAFSDQPGTVIQYASRFCRGLKQSGVLACGKHYPGHGAAAVDSHLQVPEISVSREYFMRYCFQPFEALVKQGIDSLLTGHIRFPELCPEIATFSPYLVGELLRKKTGYNGVIFTDCLEMKAVKGRYSPGDIVRKAIEAGVDVLAPTRDFDFQKELLAALRFYVKKGTIPEARIDESVARILALKDKLKALAVPGKNETGGETPRLRMNIEKEQEIADRSITVLRNRRHVLPVSKNKKTLVLEWARRISGPSVHEQEKESMIASVSARYLEDRDLEVLKPDEAPPRDLAKRLADYAYVVMFIYSRTGDIDRCQTEAVNALLKLRSDLIIISLENPYEIKKFPSVDTYAVTYGFRRVQIEAMFKVLTGETVPAGRLPVEIKGLFPRGFSHPG